MQKSYCEGDRLLVVTNEYKYYPDTVRIFNRMQEDMTLLKSSVYGVIIFSYAEVSHNRTQSKLKGE